MEWPHILKNKKVINLPAQKVNVIDTVGAGDTFNAGFLAKLKSIKIIIKKANVKNLSIKKHIKWLWNMELNAASITVSRKGANPPLIKRNLNTSPNIYGLFLIQ